MTKVIPLAPDRRLYPIAREIRDGTMELMFGVCLPPGWVFHPKQCVVLIGLFGIVACEAIGAAFEPLRNVGEMQAVGWWDVRQNHPLEMSGVVTFVDPAKKLIVLQDQTGAVAVHVPAIPAHVQLGHSMLLTAPDAEPFLEVVPDFDLGGRSMQVLPDFEEAARLGDRYVARMRGYLRPQQTGSYRFWISSDDTSELWLGEDETIASARQIARVDSWKRPHEWERSPEQKSESIHLVAGREYFIEALHDQRGGDAHLSVAWEGPGFTRAVVTGMHIRPWEPTASESRSNGVTLETWPGAAVDGVWQLSSGRTFASSISVAKPTFVDRGRAPWPQPLALALGQSLSVSERYRWSWVAGVVDFIGEQDGQLLLEIVEGERRVRVLVAKWEGEDPHRLRQRRIAVTGVAEPGTSGTDDAVLAGVWVPSGELLHASDSTSRGVSARSVAIIDLLSPEKSWPPAQPLRITGTVVAREGPHGFRVRDEGTIAGYLSEDGTAWQKVGRARDVAMSSDLVTGFALSSGSSEESSVASFEPGVSFSAALQYENVGSLPSEKQLTIDGGVWRFRGRGRDIWNRPDQFDFLYERTQGAGEYVARIVDFQASDSGAKFGLMMRENLAPDAQFVNLVYNHNRGVTLEWRRNGIGVAPKSSAVLPVRPPFSLKLVRQYSEISVAADEDLKAPVGASVEVTGFYDNTAGEPRIVEAYSRAVEATASVKSSESYIRPLLDLAQVATDSSSNEPSPDAFRVRGLVTFAGQVNGRRYLAIQDRSRGLLVQTRANAELTAPMAGQWVEVHSNPGWNAPEPGLVADAIYLLGRGADPQAVRHPLEYLLPERGEGSLVEISGIVRAVLGDGFVEVKENGERFTVFVNGAGPELLNGWVDAAVRIRGVICFPNAQESLLLVSGARNVEIVEPASSFELPLRPLTSFDPLALRNGSRHRVRTDGVVTYQGDGFIFIQSSSTAARVFTPQASAFREGDRVEVLGFPDLGEDGSVVLSHALVHRTGADRLPEPMLLSGTELLRTDLGAKRVRLSARLVHQRFSEAEVILDVQTEHRPVRVVFKDRPRAPFSAPDGSLLQISGIWTSDTSVSDRNRDPFASASIPDVRVLAGSPSDVIVLQKPRWWVVKRTALFAGVIGLAGALVLIWIQILRRRVRERTTELNTTMTKLKQETLVAATLAERNRLAGEIHDSLEQGFSGLLLQLDTTAKLAVCPPEIRAGLNLARSMVAFSRAEVQHAVWDLQSPLLEHADLRTALAKMIEQLNPDAPRLHMVVTGETRVLPSSTEHHLLRIAQEAINNSIKHAQAASIAVSVVYEPSTLTLSVHDDGVGFDPNRVLSGGLGHFGLRSLRGRAAKIGGEITIASRLGAGTTVSVSVPITVI